MAFSIETFWSDEGFRYETVEVYWTFWLTVRSNPLGSKLASGLLMVGMFGDRFIEFSPSGAFGRFSSVGKYS